MEVQRYLLPYALDFLRLCVWLVLLALVFVPLERIFALHPQKIFRRAFLPDLFLFFVNGLLPKLILVIPAALIGSTAHFFVPHGLQARVAAMPLLLRFLAATVVGEFGFYWGHRWSHRIPLLWRFHSVHHAAEQMDWLVNTHAHPVDLVFTRVCGFIPLYIVGLAQPIGQSVDVVPLLVIVVAIAWGFFVHANLRWRFGPLEWLIATPGFHHWHHTCNDPIDRNYSSMLPWVDWIFGTLYLPARQWPLKYGTQTPVSADITAELIDSKTV